jgi:hypothetical protein
LDKADIFKDPLALVNLYANGKGTLWKTNAEAEKFISKNGFAIATGQLKRSTVLLRYPDEIINLFALTGINSQTGRRLGTARKKYGLEELVKKAKEMTPARNPAERSNILAVLNGKTPRALPRDLLPVEMVRIYEDGLHSNRWANPSQACVETGLGTKLYKALEITSLPDRVLALFSVETLTFATGKKLIGLLAAYGIDGLLGRATWAANPNSKISDNQKIAILSAHESSVAAEVKTKRGRGKVIIEFHIPDSAGAISAQLPEITSILDMAVGMFVKKRTKRNTNFSNQTGNINAN